MQEERSRAVFRTCKRYAKSSQYPWSTKDGVGSMVLPSGLATPDLMHFKPVEDGVNIFVEIAKNIPHGFYSTSFKLFPVSEGRLSIYEGTLHWTGNFSIEQFEKRSGFNSFMGWALREIFLARALLRLHYAEGRQILWPAVLGIGRESEFDAMN